MKQFAFVVVGMALSVPSVAAARDYCPTRPSLGQSACTVEAGHFAIETALTDWERSRDSDTVLFGDTLFRLGLSDATELQVEWTPIGVARDRPIGRNVARTGDLEVGTRIALRNPDGKGLSYGLQPSVLVPVGRSPIGDGGWGAAMVAPVSYDLSDRLNLQFSPEIAWLPREQGRGNMVVATATVGLGLTLSKACQLTTELQFERADDVTDHRLALAVAWQLSDDVFIDTGGAAGLDDHTPELRLYSGISKRF
ncbi:MULTISPECIES: transporter [unclassified Sphingomonas]|uniref:transporter n=1 Tax=unclassified Sphingomonas TaxID=196159 RepID=UPI0006F87806|nr:MULTISPECIES: transporter [unclassified Sphingomonas]